MMKWGEEMGGRPSKPVAVNKKHLTNAEKEQRLNYESALLSGKKITERKRVREDKTAHAEFKRVVGLMRAIGKDDALYSEQINRYAELHSECEFYKDLARNTRAELAELDELSHEICAAAGFVAENFGGIDDEIKAGTVAESAGKLLEALSELIDKRGSLLKQMSDADTKIKQKREAMLAIERENCMTVSAALRTIPKDVHKDDDDELLKVLRE